MARRQTEQHQPLKVALGQLNVDTGHPYKNLQKAKDAVDQARDEAAQLLILSEMAISGYMVSDMLEDRAYVEDCMGASTELREYSEGISVIWGDVVGDTRWGQPNGPRNRHNPLARGNDGRFLRYNAAHVATNGEAAQTAKELPTWEGFPLFPLPGMTVKTNLPLYNQFEDQRQMLPLKELAQRLGFRLEDLLQPFIIDNHGQPLKVGVLICEDIWTGDYFYNGKLLNPAAILRDNGADILVAVSSSPSHVGKQQRRIISTNRLMKGIAETGNGRTLPLISVNHLGTQDNGKNIYIFDGRARVLSADGTKDLTTTGTQEGIEVAYVPVESATSFSPTPEVPATKHERHEDIHNLLITGLRSFCEKRGMKRIVIGLSGGVDSAVVACLCVEALGADNVLAINMPTRFNDQLTKDAAREIADTLGIAYQIVPIEDQANAQRDIIRNVSWHGDYGAYSDETVKPGVDQKTADAARLVDENAQAKIRTKILSDIAAKYGAVFTNNGNKTEVLQGFYTLDGDGRGFLAIIADLFKTPIIDQAVFINERAMADGQQPPIPWGLIAPLFDGERYYDNWDGQQSPIPPGTREIVASAELSEAQAVAQGKGDPMHFVYHDQLLQKWAEERFNIEDIAQVLNNEGLVGLKNFLGLTDLAMRRTFGTYFPTPADFIADLEKRWRLYHQATIFKQIQSPPVIAISERPEGYDHRRSQIAADLSQTYLRLKENILKMNSWELFE